ncbi:MAG TPA: ABC-F family ATP-binding cassette domain-containing protein [Tepidiformaceae bacterium]|nr:ABC-F family ATP-binding cassette domain-containing protein [Tepidiformaceae bacterium]
MILVDLNGIGRVYGGRTIWRGLSWSIRDGEKIGLIGASGGGKSTLMRVLAGAEKPDEGAATSRRGARIASLPQEYTGEAGRAALDELLAAREDVAALDARIADVEYRLSLPESLEDAEAFDRLLEEQASLIREYETSGALMVRNRAEGMLRALGFPEASWAMPMERLSGGQRKLIGLARCLIAEPELLLLDEPDNHLDLERKALLENVVREFEGAVVVISHDRYLLDDTVSVIVEMETARDGTRLKRWEGNYSAYVAQREIAMLRQAQDFASQQKEIARLEEAVTRFKQWARVVVDERHIKQARNKQRQIDRMEKVERPVLERRRMSLHFRAGQRGGAKVVELRGVAKAFGERAILRPADALVRSGERVGIVGANGAGKTVLLRLILGELAPDAGEVWTGPSIRMGYYGQEHETLDFAQTPIQAIREVKNLYEGEAVAALQRFLIPYDACSQPIAQLSGGEKSRVQLARLMLSGANCLVLDEPTNNLDIPAAEVLEGALDAYDGTVVVVSHDRYFLDRLVDRIFEVRDGRLVVHEGSYSEYAARAAV